MNHEKVHATVHSLLAATKAEVGDDHKTKIEIQDESEPKVLIPVEQPMGSVALMGAVEIEVTPHDGCKDGEACGYTAHNKVSGEVVFESYPDADTKDRE